jgi:hypothetical protein
VASGQESRGIWTGLGALLAIFGLGAFVASFLMDWETFSVKSSTTTSILPSSSSASASMSFPIGAPVSQYGLLYPLGFAALVVIASIGLSRSVMATPLRLAAVGLAVVTDAVVWATLQNPLSYVFSGMSSLLGVFGGEVASTKTLETGAYLALAGAPLLVLGMLGAALDARPAKVKPAVPVQPPAPASDSTTVPAS